MPSAVAASADEYPSNSRSLGTDPDQIGQHVADLLLHGFAAQEREQ